MQFKAIMLLRKISTLWFDYIQVQFAKNYVKSPKNCRFLHIRYICQVGRIFGRIISAGTGRIFGIGRTLFQKQTSVNQGSRLVLDYRQMM